MEIDLSKVNWHRDTVTEHYIKDHEAMLKDPKSMTPSDLCGAVTYCQTVENPYAEELTLRAGVQEKFHEADSLLDKAKVLRTAAKAFGITLI